MVRHREETGYAASRYNAPTLSGLPAWFPFEIGLLQNQNRLGGNVWLDFVDDPEKQNDIIVTSFGKTFYHNSPAALNRN